MKRKRITRTRIGVFLLEQRLITERQLEEALARQQADSKPLGEILLEMASVAERPAVEGWVAQALTEQYGFPRLPLDSFEIDRTVVSLVPERFARSRRLIPVNQAGSNVTVAMADPLDTESIRDLETFTRCTVHPLISTPSEIQQAIDCHYRER